MGAVRTNCAQCTQTLRSARVGRASFNKDLYQPLESAVFPERSGKYFATGVLHFIGIGISRKRCDNSESVGADLRNTWLPTILPKQVSEHNLSKDLGRPLLGSGRESN